MTGSRTHDIRVPAVAPGGLDGLDGDEVSQRVQRGLANDVPSTPTRSIGGILRANVLTRFNAVLGGLLVVILVVGDLRDALFGLVLVANSGIGIIQELRAKRTLDRLVLLTAPRARVVRAGQLSDVPATEVVRDDVIDLRPGDQVVVDGDVLISSALEIDETLLTGESDPVPKAVGGQVLSGSFVVAGSGRYRATRVGRDAYATRVADEARSFTLFSSRLRADIDTILRMATWALLPTAAVLLVSQLRAHASVDGAVAASVGGVVAMVPEGLVLLTSTAFAVAVVRLARQRTLVQELAAVEGLARADVLCLDKTGTLTEGAITFAHIEVLVETEDVASAIGAVAAADPNPNATLRAIAGRFAAPSGWVADANVAFSSARKYAAVSFGDRGAWILGAPDILLAGVATSGDVPERIAGYVEDGRRVVMLARAPAGAAMDPLPHGLEPAALVVLADTLRPDARAVLGSFARDEVAVKLISGDDPRTVGALGAPRGTHARPPRRRAAPAGRRLRAHRGGECRNGVRTGDAAAEAGDGAGAAIGRPRGCHDRRQRQRRAGAQARRHRLLWGRGVQRRGRCHSWCCWTTSSRRCPRRWRRAGG